MRSNCSCTESEDVLNVVFMMIRGHRELSLAIAAAGLVLIVVFVAVISVFCDRKCRKGSWRPSAAPSSEAVTAAKDPPSVVANEGVESARCKDAVVVESRQTRPSAGTVCSTVSELTKQSPGKDEGTSNGKSFSCGGNTETDICQQNQPTPKDPISPKEAPKDLISPKEAPKDPISPKETTKGPISSNETQTDPISHNVSPKDPISPKETPKDPISHKETNGQDGVTAVRKSLGAARQSAVDKESDRCEGEFNQVNDMINDGPLTASENSLTKVAAVCLQDQKNGEDSKANGQSGLPQFAAANALAMSEYKRY